MRTQSSIRSNRYRAVAAEMHERASKTLNDLSLPDEVAARGAEAYGKAARVYASRVTPKADGSSWEPPASAVEFPGHEPVSFRERLQLAQEWSREHLRGVLKNATNSLELDETSSNRDDSVADAIEIWAATCGPDSVVQDAMWRILEARQPVWRPPELTTSKQLAVRQLALNEDHWPRLEKPLGKLLKNHISDTLEGLVQSEQSQSEFLPTLNELLSILEDQKRSHQDRADAAFALCDQPEAKEVLISTYRLSLATRALGHEMLTEACIDALANDATMRQEFRAGLQAGWKHGDDRIATAWLRACATDEAQLPELLQIARQQGWFGSVCESFVGAPVALPWFVENLEGPRGSSAPLTAANCLLQWPAAPSSHSVYATT